MVNKAQLLDANLAQNLVIAKKVIPVLVDFTHKMEELLDEMRILFDGLQPEVPPVVAENLLDISGEIPSLTGWGRRARPRLQRNRINWDLMNRYERRKSQ